MSQDTTLSETSSVTMAPTTIPGIPPATTNLTDEPRQAEFTQCFGGGTAFSWPAALAPGESVPGWPKPDPLTAPSWYLDLIQCQRVNWGPFERGPIHFIFEYHENTHAPDSCLAVHPPEVGVGSLSALYAIWVDDGAVGAWLNATYGIPVRVADIQVVNSTTGPAHSQAWTWVLPSGEKSDVTFSASGSDVAPHPYLERLAFKAHGRLHLFDYQVVGYDVTAKDPVTPGDMGPTMLYSQAGPSQYLGRGDLHESVEAHLNVWIYKDMECKEPA